jgi:DNA polymerase-3 subunit gamma/tau
MEFLFDAIAVLTALDAGLRTATNPRLNVELSLMKLAGLNKKKTDAVRSLNETAGALPELKREGASVRSEALDNASSKSKTDSSATPGKSDDNISRPPTGGGGVRPVSQSEAVSASEQPASPKKSQTDASAPEMAASPQTLPAMSADNKPKPVSKPKSILSGNSIGDIINGASGIRDIAAPPAEGEPAPAPDPVDPDAEAKINAARGQFLNEVYTRRPRIAMAMEEMSVERNMVSVAVPSEQLREEILRNRSEILTLLAETAGVTGSIDLNVVVRDDNTARKPVKAEDKLKFLTGRNPALTALRKELNLEIE